MERRAEPDSETVRRARDGDARARETLWQANRRWVAAIILAHRPRTVDVDDLMQDVAIKYLTKLDTLRDPEAFRPWLRRIAINACRGAGRRARTPLHFAAGETAGPGEIPLTDAHVRTSARHAELRDAAEHLLERAMTLPSEYREPLLLRSLKEMSYHQIAEILDLPVTTVETRLARARRMLRDELREELEPDRQ